MKLTLLSMVALMGSQINFCDAIRLAGNSIAAEDAAIGQTLAQTEKPLFLEAPGHSGQGMCRRKINRKNSGGES